MVTQITERTITKVRRPANGNGQKKFVTAKTTL